MRYIWYFKSMRETYLMFTIVVFGFPGVYPLSEHAPMGLVNVNTGVALLPLEVLHYGERGIAHVLCENHVV